MTKHEVPTARDNAPQPVRSLREWLDHLAARDRMVVLKPNLGLKFELAAYAKRFDGQRATVFPKPGGHPIPVVSGIISDRGWMAEAMGVEPAEMLARFQDAAVNPLPWQEVTSAPAQEVVHRQANGQLDLAKILPLPTHNEHDGGPYIAAGIMVVRNPRTGKQNVSIHRCQLTGPNRLGVLVLPRHTFMFHRMAEEAGQPLDAAIVVGVDPLTLLASQAIVPMDQDELEIAGACSGGAAGGEVPDERHPRAGRGRDRDRGAIPARRARAGRAVRRIPAVLRRARQPRGDGDRRGDAPQGRDLPHHGGRRARAPLLGAVPKEATLLTHLRRTFPGVLDVHLSPGGTMRFHLYVKIKKNHEGQGKNVILGAFAGSFDLKHVIVVDEDVDIHDPREVEWAVATRFQADRDLVIVPESQGSKLDPSNRDGVGAKMGLDATKPLAAPAMKFTRIRVPGEEAIDAAEVLKRSPGTDWRAALKP